jgi:hypothetical protein
MARHSAKVKGKLTKCLSLWGKRLRRGGKEASKPNLNEAKTEVYMLRDRIKVVRRGKRKRVTGGKQNAKRSQRAGRRVADGAGNDKNLRKAGWFTQMLVS